MVENDAKPHWRLPSGFRNPDRTILFQGAVLKGGRKARPYIETLRRGGVYPRPRIAR